MTYDENAEWWAAQRRAADAEPDEITSFLRHLDLDLMRSPEEYDALLTANPDHQVLLDPTFIAFGRLLVPEQRRTLTPEQARQVDALLRKMDARAHQRDFGPTVTPYLPSRADGQAGS